MNNFMPSLAITHLPFLEQTLVASTDERLCIIDTFREDLKCAPKGEPYNWLFLDTDDNGSFPSAPVVRRQINSFTPKIFR